MSDTKVEGLNDALDDLERVLNMRPEGVRLNLPAAIIAARSALWRFRAEPPASTARCTPTHHVCQCGAVSSVSPASTAAAQTAPLELLESVLEAWTNEANQGDGIDVRNAAIYVKARRYVDAARKQQTKE